MIKNLYAVLFCCIFFSCSAYLPYSVVKQTKSITDIPLKATAETVDCFFNNQLPTKPFYKVKITEVTGADYASYDDLLFALKTKAKGEGLDGVMILDKQQEIRYENLNKKITVRDTAVNYYSQLAKPYQKLTAIGIKYVENINYMDTIVKSTVFEFAKSDTTKGKVNFDFYGNKTGIINTGFGKYYADSIEPFCIEKHLLAAVNGWQYRTTNATITEVIAFQKLAGQTVEADVKRDYTDVNKFYYNFFNPLTGKHVKYVLKIEKNANGKIIKKILSQKKAVIWVEEIYHTSNTVTGCKRYHVNNGKEEIIYTTVNQYFSVNDLPKSTQN
jgi:hypothetical protein